MGSFVIGVISDYFGRSRAISASILLTSVSAILTTLINDKISLALLRVVYGIGTKGCIMVLYVMAAESTLPNYKVFIMFVGGIGFQFGEVCFAIEAYFLRSFQKDMDECDIFYLNERVNFSITYHSVLREGFCLNIF